MAGAERVRGLLVHALREGGVDLEVAADVGAAPLHEVAGEAPAHLVAFGPVQVFHGEVGEVVLEQAEERAECLLVAAVRGRGHQHDVAGGVGGHPPEERVALLAAPADPAREGASVRLVHDHALRALEGEVFGAPRGLDEVGGDDGERVPVEDGHPEGEVPLQALDGAREHQLRLDVELLGQLALPLFGEVRRAEHRQAADLAAVEQLAGDEARLDGLADADVVGDEHPHRVELERHHQRHELVGPGLDRDAAEAAERAGGGAGREAGGVAEEPARGEVAEVFPPGEPERRGLDRLDRREDAGDLLVQPAGRAEHQEVAGRFGEDHPFAAARRDEGAGLEGGCSAHVVEGRIKGSPGCAQGYFTLSGDEVLAGILPSPAGRGAGGEGPGARNCPDGGSMPVFPSPQTPLPGGEGL